MPYRFLVGFRKIGTHLRTRGGCYLSTFGSRHDSYPNNNYILDEFLNCLIIEIRNLILYIQITRLSAMEDSFCYHVNNTTKFKGNEEEQGRSQKLKIVPKTFWDVRGDDKSMLYM